MTCPECFSAKMTGGIACGSSGCSVVLIKCSLCRGSGKIPDEQGPWIAEGRRRRQWRLDHDRSLREEATRLGISPALLSDGERGRVDPQSVWPAPEGDAR